MNPTNDYIIVYQNPAHKEQGFDNGWHPVTYANGSLVIYGSKEEALSLFHFMTHVPKNPQFLDGRRGTIREEGEFSRGPAARFP